MALDLAAPLSGDAVALSAGLWPGSGLESASRRRHPGRQAPGLIDLRPRLDQLQVPLIAAI